MRTSCSRNLAPSFFDPAGLLTAATTHENIPYVIAQLSKCWPKETNCLGRTSPPPSSLLLLGWVSFRSSLLFYTRAQRFYAHQRAAAGISETCNRARGRHVHHVGGVTGVCDAISQGRRSLRGRTTGTRCTKQESGSVTSKERMLRGRTCCCRRFARSILWSGLIIALVS